MKEIKTGKKSNVKHTRAVQHDRSQRAGGAPTEEANKRQLLEIVHPATLAQMGLFQSLGLRVGTLTLPVMVALAMSLIWRQTGNVSGLVMSAPIIAMKPMICLPFLSLVTSCSV